MDPKTLRIYLSRNVVFDEIVFPSQGMATSSLPAKDSSQGTVLLPSHFFSINSMPIDQSHVMINSHEISSSVAHNPTASSHDINLPLTQPILSNTIPAAIDFSISSQSDNDLSLTGIHRQSSIPATSPLPPHKTPFVVSEPIPIEHVPTSLFQPTCDTSHDTTSDIPHRVTTSYIGTLKPKTFPYFQLYNVTKHPLNQSCCFPSP
jgi:hypothetical protein